MNQRIITGPNTLPIPVVPLTWTANSTPSRTMVTGITATESAGAATPSPSMAASTLMAGVIMPSPNSSPAPSISDHNMNVMPRRRWVCSSP